MLLDNLSLPPERAFSLCRGWNKDTQVRMDSFFFEGDREAIQAVVADSSTPSQQQHLPVLVESISSSCTNHIEALSQCVQSMPPTIEFPLNT